MLRSFILSFIGHSKQCDELISSSDFPLLVRICLFYPLAHLISDDSLCLFYRMHHLTASRGDPFKIYKQPAILLHCSKLKGDMHEQ